jgi:putative ABC transport system permease protein
MIKSFFIVAYRNFVKNKSFTFINITGLSVGIASAVFIMLFILSELSYDRNFTNSERIYRLYLDGNMSGSEIKGAWTSPASGPILTDELPEILHYTRIRPLGQVLVKIDDKKFLEEDLVFADSTFFQIFDIPVIYGDPATMLSQPYSVVLTESVSKKYFGNLNPIGETLDTDADSSLFKVTGVIEDLPDETHLKFNLIASYSSREESRSEYWLSNFLFTYFLLDEAHILEETELKIQEILLKYIRPQLMQILGIDAEQFIKSGNSYGLFLQPLTKVHLDPSIQGGFKSPADEKYLMIFGLIALLIVVIAGINFMNLSTARATNRAKEVGMRKVVGSGKGLLIKQFLWESISLSFISLVFSLILVEVLLPYFNNMMELNLSMNYLNNWYTVPVLLALTFFVGLLSGSYPAFVLASYNPVEVLKGNLVPGLKGGLLRNILVMAQFAISIIIITGTLVIYLQLNYFTNKDLGFEKEDILVIYRIEPISENLQAFMQEIERAPSVISSTNSTIYAGTSNTRNSYQIAGRDKSSNYLFSGNWVDYNYADVYELGIIQGRFFNPAYASDSSAVLINESALKRYGISDPFTTKVIMPTDDGLGSEHTIIGVVADFHSAPLHEVIEPYIFHLKDDRSSRRGYISVKLEPGEGNTSSAIAFLESTWQSFTDDEPFQYFFLDERLNSVYLEEKRSGRLALIFSFLAIFIACLGLFGLTIYTTQRRTKEIGIRKVLGASSLRIVLMIIKEISILLGISTAIAWLISYKVSMDWLEDFAYRIPLTPFIFIAGAGIAFLIALATVTVQSYIAAQADPARSIHHD